jgi:hypothetical protein
LVRVQFIKIKKFWLLVLMVLHGSLEERRRNQKLKKLKKLKRRLKKILADNKS